MSFIADRTDMSDWLIHFVRDRDPDTDFPAEADSYDAGDLELDASAYRVLRHIIEIGAILPGFSLRETGGFLRTTIYGGAPAVCFTEAPLNGFAQYVRARGASERCAPYGVCLPKREVFGAGGRPVIYGLAQGNSPQMIQDETWVRVIDPSQLPRQEQFRYVAYNPGRSKPLDWTHEREWRWTATDNDAHRVFYNGPQGPEFYPALPLFDAGIFTQVGFIAATREEADQLSQMLLHFKDSGTNNFDTEYSERVLSRSFVIALDEALQSGSGRIEDLAPSFRLKADRPVASAKLVQKVKRVVANARGASKRRAEDFAKSTGGKEFLDVCGGAHIATDESTSPVLDAMLKLGVASSVGGMYYAVDAVSRDKPHFQALRYHEVVAEAACEVLCRELEDIFYVRTWID